MDDHTLWKIIRDGWIIIRRSYDPTVRNMIAESDLNIRQWMLLLAVLTFEPEDTTPSHLLIRDPYTSCEQYQIRLEQVAIKGYLKQVSEGRYRLSDKGRRSILEFIKNLREAMLSVDLLPEPEAKHLAEMFSKLVVSSLETPPPPNPWSINLSYKLIPAADPPVPYIEQAISCLSAYRDDSHLAAWRSSGLSAIALESLTLYWQEQVKTLEDIIEQLSFRGHPERIYADALDELRDRGFVSGFRNAPYLTEVGRSFRDEVEVKTDHYFYHPWKSLTNSEKNSLAEILNNIQVRL